MCVAGLCCFSALEVTVKKNIKGEKKKPFPLFFKQAWASAVILRPKAIAFLQPHLDGHS